MTSKFVDYVEISVKSGKGGQGAVSFRREKYVPKGGPDGGDGGDGGSIILQASGRLQTLMDLKIKKHYSAQNGWPGRPKNQTGARGKDLTIHVPRGTMVFDNDKKLIADLTSDNQTATICKGGKGGRGNARFSTPSNRAPRYAQPGLYGEESKIILELRLIAEVGLIGLPNAGKSTLLKTLTRSNPKIADYPFTTLYPNLGVLKTMDREVVIADIPGLIEGASEGHGLGHDFLRHIDRTKLLFHLVDTCGENPEQTFKNYQTVTNELKKSIVKLSDKNTIVLLTKIDIIEHKGLEPIQDLFEKNGIKTLAVSALTKTGLESLVNVILKNVE
ncbi:GTPase ObgE [Thermoproteota archaeon]